MVNPGAEAAFDGPAADGPAAEGTGTGAGGGVDVDPDAPAFEPYDFKMSSNGLNEDGCATLLSGSFFAGAAAGGGVAGCACGGGSNAYAGTGLARCSAGWPGFQPAEKYCALADAAQKRVERTAGANFMVC